MRVSSRSSRGGSLNVDEKEKLGIQFLEHAQRFIALFCKRFIGKVQVCKEGFIVLLNSISVLQSLI
jgi:hypothetical protein